MAFTLNIETDNAEFADHPAAEIARILQDVAHYLTAGSIATLANGESMKLRDINGNTVGHWEFTAAPENVWTFFGHWEDDQIVLEYHVAGEVEDDREDDGYWDQGLWAASGSGDTWEQAWETVRAEYEGAV